MITIAYISHSLLDLNMPIITQPHISKHIFCKFFIFFFFEILFGFLRFYSVHSVRPKSRPKMSIGIEEKINFKKSYCTNRIEILNSALITVCYCNFYFTNQKTAKKQILQLTVQEVKTKKVYCTNLKYFLKESIPSIIFLIGLFFGEFSFFLFLEFLPQIPSIIKSIDREQKNKNNRIRNTTAIGWRH